MAITAAGHNKMKDFMFNLIKEGRYTMGGVKYTTPIFKTERVGDTMTFYLYLDDSVNGTISKFELIDQAGEVFDDQPDNISKPTLNGLLVKFTYTLRRV